MATSDVYLPNPPLSLYRDDPVGFVTDVLGNSGAPYDKQRQFLELAARSRRVSVVGCNGSGKDWTAARIVLWWIETRPRAKAVVTGPTQRQVQDILWREMRAAHAASRTALQGLMYASRYVVDDTRFAIGFSTDSPFNLQGFHSPELLAVVTEAHAVEQDYVNALKRLNPRLLVLTGNPLTMTGEFYDSHHGGAGLYARLAISAFDTPNVRQGHGAVPGMLTLEDVEERRREWGEDSQLYRAAVLAEFPEALGDTLIPRSALRNAVERYRVQAEPPGPPGSHSSPERPQLGIDVARFGDDKTVLCLRRGERVELLEEWAHQDLMLTAQRAKELAEPHNAQAVFVDATGLGAGVADRLIQLGVRNVVAVQVGAAARNRERFLNLRAELFWGLRERFLEGRIAIPDDPALESQLLSLRYDFTASGQIRIQSKSEIKARGGASPDKADALALAFQPLPSLQIWV